MKYTEFQHLARLFAVGALDPDELEAFTTGRLRFGKRAEAYLRECRDLNTLLALSLRPMAVRPGTKATLMQQIRQSLPHGERAPFDRREPAPEEHSDAFEEPLTYEPSYRN